VSAPHLDLGDFLRGEALDAEIVAPGVPMPTVEAAARAMGCEPDRIFKSILFQSRADGGCVLVVACGMARVDARRVEAVTGSSRLRLASADVVQEVTGYPAGGTPPVGHRTRIPAIVDRRVAAQDWGYAGGGRSELLVRIASADIIRLTGARVEDVV
jgi:prolyl-tRNA editing enzyme YbaK/EbsC (Cys-tRNA(Pro) deacylase)